MQREFSPCVYILATHRNGSTYVGVTSNLLQRLCQHREDVFEGHSKKHQIKRLVWFEMHGTMETAIVREKRIKKWNRAWKAELIEKSNPSWRDLGLDFGFEPTPSRRIN